MDDTNENLETAEEGSALDNLEIVEKTTDQADSAAEETAGEESAEEAEIAPAEAGEESSEAYAKETETASAEADEEDEAVAAEETQQAEDSAADAVEAEDEDSSEEVLPAEDVITDEADDKEDSTQGDSDTSEPEDKPQDEDVSDKADSEEATDEAKKPRSKKPILIACGSVVGALAAAYIGGVIFFSGHFMPNTTVNGEDASMKSAAELASDVDSRLASMNPRITGQGLNLAFAANDVNIQVDSDAFAKSALQQENSLAWPVEVFGTHELTANYPVTYNKGTLTRLVHSAVEEVNKDGKEPQDAKIAFNKKSKVYEAVAGDAGTLVDESAVIAAVDMQLQNLNGEVTLNEEALKKPRIAVDNEKLVSAVDKANGYVANAIVFKSGDKELFALDGLVMKDWINVDEDFVVTYNEETARYWLDNNLRSKVDTAGSTRKYKREDGETVEVTGGTYGWAFTLDGVTDKVLKKIKKQKGGTIKLKTIKTGSTWNPGGRDWEGKYIDIDLGDQYARLFDKKGKVIWESDIVSGNTSAGNGTPTGVYVVNGSMARNVTLVSSQTDDKGKPTYESPVSYWMPFVDNSVGLHDANWRGEFGGGIYTYNGSHGCVNLPPSKAASLYELIEPGIVVSCHY